MSDFHPGERFGLIGRHGELILDASAARLLNEIRSEIKRLSNLVGVPPVSVSEDGSGRRISIDLVEPIIAKLAGSAGPYSFTEQSWTGTAWADKPDGRTGTNAYEVNGRTGLGGKVYRLRHTLVDDWRFQDVRLGAAAATTAFHIQFTVTSTCQGARSGALCTVVKAGVTRTCTTDATGVCTIDVPTIGSFTWTVALAGYTTQSGSGSVSAPGTIPENVSLGTPTGFSCLCSGISSGVPGPCPNVPLPSTLHASDGLGSFTLSVGGVSGSNLWEACITRTGTGRDAATCSISQSVSPTLACNFTCGGNPSQFALSIGGITCFGAGGVGEFLKPNPTCGTAGTFAGANSTTSLTCSPFSWTGTGTLPPTHPLYSIYGGSFTWSVTA